MTPAEAIEFAYPQLLAHFVSALPNEAVGFILEDGQTIRLINQARSPHRFWISGDQVAERLYPRTPDHIVVVYHTHPERPARPSGEDRRFMRELFGVWPHVLHLILSRTDSAVYAVLNSRIEELQWHRSHSLPTN